MLEGGSYLDLFPLFEVSFSYGYDIFHHVLEHWIYDDNLVKINGAEYIQNDG